MAIYRVLRDLNTGHVRGDLVDGDQFKSLAKLVEVRALAEAKSPPLSELPGWETRAEKLNTIGVVTIQDFLDADLKRVADLFSHKRPLTGKKWQEDVKQYLRVEPKKKK